MKFAPKAYTRTRCSLEGEVALMRYWRMQSA
jgi:hypothetical protein